MSPTNPLPAARCPLPAAEAQRCERCGSNGFLAWAAGGAVLAERVTERVTARSPLCAEVRASALGGSAVSRGALPAAMDAAQDELFGPSP